MLSLGLSLWRRAIAGLGVSRAAIQGADGGVIQGADGVAIEGSE